MDWPLLFFQFGRSSQGKTLNKYDQDSGSMNSYGDTSASKH